MARDPKLIQKEVIEHFAKDLPQSHTRIVLHSDLSTLTWAPLMYRYPWDIIFGNICKGNITVAGDAMHPMTPDLGQNECAALEDAVVLGQQIGELIASKASFGPKEVAQALAKYAQKRRWCAAGLIAISFVSGWVQLGGPGWLMKFLRDVVFYRLLYNRYWMLYIMIVGSCLVFLMHWIEKLKKYFSF